MVRSYYIPDSTACCQADTHKRSVSLYPPVGGAEKLLSLTVLVKLAEQEDHLVSSKGFEWQLVSHSLSLLLWLPHGLEGLAARQTCVNVQ